MVDATAEETGGLGGRRGRGPSKTYPIKSFGDALKLANAIHEHGFRGEVLGRLDAMRELGFTQPAQQAARDLVSSSSKYGLTLGHFNSEELKLTADAATLLGSTNSPEERKRLEFELAIGRIKPFQQLYELLKGERLPRVGVIQGRLTDVPQLQRPECAKIFVENVEYLGLVERQGTSAGLRRIEDVIAEVASQQRGSVPKPEPTASKNASYTNEYRSEQPVIPRPSVNLPSSPTLHIDINIHIDASASSDQIDQMFASMARHLFQRGE